MGTELVDMLGLITRGTVSSPGLIMHEAIEAGFRLPFLLACRV